MEKTSFKTDVEQHKQFSQVNINVFSEMAALWREGVLVSTYIFLIIIIIIFDGSFVLVDVYQLCMHDVAHECSII